MSIRWKTAVKFGLVWGFIMSLLWLLYELQERTFHDIITSKGFWLRALAYTALGVFPIGYFSYKKKED